MAHFNEPNVGAAAGLVPVMVLACNPGLPGLADEYLSVPTDKGVNAGLKACSLVAGMVQTASMTWCCCATRHGQEGRADRRHNHARSPKPPNKINYPNSWINYRAHWWIEAYSRGCGV